MIPSFPTASIESCAYTVPLMLHRTCLLRTTVLHPLTGSRVSVQASCPARWQPREGHPPAAVLNQPLALELEENSEVRIRDFLYLLTGSLHTGNVRQGGTSFLLGSIPIS